MAEAGNDAVATGQGGNSDRSVGRMGWEGLLHGEKGGVVCCSRSWLLKGEKVAYTTSSSKR